MNFYGLLGKNLTYSISPEIHQAIYQKAAIQAAYKKISFPEEQLTQVMEAIKVLDLRGVNVTIPYKELVIPYLDDLSPLAKKLGAVNTIRQEAGKLYGDNTDYAGIELTFDRQQWQVEGRNAYVLGTGGASKAVVQYLIDHGAAKVSLVSRQPANYQGSLACIDYHQLGQVEGDYLINSTPVGTSPAIDQSPVGREILARFTHVFDLIYNPEETKLLSLAKEEGLQVVNGLTMLIGQAIKAVEIWEGQTFADDLLDQILAEFRNYWS